MSTCHLDRVLPPPSCPPDRTPTTHGGPKDGLLPARNQSCVGQAPQIGPNPVFLPLPALSSLPVSQAEPRLLPPYVEDAPGDDPQTPSHRWDRPQDASPA